MSYKKNRILIALVFVLVTMFLNVAHAAKVWSSILLTETGTSFYQIHVIGQANEDGSPASIDGLYFDNQSAGGSSSYSPSDLLLAFDPLNPDNDPLDLFALAGDINVTFISAAPEPWDFVMQFTALGYVADIGGQAELSCTIFSCVSDIFPGSLYSELSGDIWFFESASNDVSSVPIPAAAWLFGSGLVGLVSVARRKKA